MLKDPQILRNYLKNNSITQTELADKLGMTRQNLVFHLSKDSFTTDFIERLRGIGIDLSIDKFNSIREGYIQQGHTPNAPTMGQDQANTLLIAINSATYANTELLCELVSKATGEPIQVVRARANQLTRAKLRTVEQLLDRLIPVSSDNSKDH